MSKRNLVNGKFIKIDFDDSEIQNYLDRLIKEYGYNKSVELLEEFANEILSISGDIVPFKEGDLLKSGAVKPIPDGWRIFYNKVYAAYQHEGVRADGTRRIRHYNNGRQGKYLERPIKENINRMLQVVLEGVKKDLSK